MRIEVSAKNVEQAIEKGLKELGKTQEEVDIKIIEEGGFFKKAKVEIIYEDGKSTKVEKQDKKAIKESKKADKKADKKEAKQEKKIVEEKATDKVCSCGTECTCSDCKCGEEERLDDKYYDEMIRVGTEFLTGMFDKLGEKNTIETNITKDGLFFSINGENVNDLIGYRGEALNSIQYLLSLVVRNKCEKSVRVFVDVENYKLRRENTLINLGTRLAHKAAKLGKPVKLEPMNAYERRIIHTALSEDKFVTTKSEGEEPNRYLVIIPNKK